MEVVGDRNVTAMGAGLLQRVEGGLATGRMTNATRKELPSFGVRLLLGPSYRASYFDLLLLNTSILRKTIIPFTQVYGEHNTRISLQRT